MYIFAFLLLTVAIYALYLAAARWRQLSLWRLLLFFAGVCAAIAIFRFYPMFADAAVLSEGLAKVEGPIRSNDVLDFFVITSHPITGPALHSLFKVPPDAIHSGAYIDWLRAEPAGPVRLINLPQRPPGVGSQHFPMCLQTLSGHPQASGFVHRSQENASDYIRGNAILRAWE